jgi:peptide deformylase
MILKLVPAEAKILRQVQPETWIMNWDHIGHMMQTLLNKGGLGLAAPQVGLPYRCFVTHWGDVFINPVITARSIDCEIECEGCLSFPGLAVSIKRSKTVTVSGRRYSGLQARVIQHEMDHLNGILITDYLSERKCA